MKRGNGGEEYENLWSSRGVTTFDNSLVRLSIGMSRFKLFPLMKYFAMNAEVCHHEGHSSFVLPQALLLA